MVTFLYDVAGLSHQMMYEKMPDNDRRKNISHGALVVEWMLYFQPTAEKKLVMKLQNK